MFVHYNKTAFVHLEANRLLDNILGIRATAYGNNEFIEGLCLVTFSVSVFNSDGFLGALARNFTAGHPSAELDIQALFDEELLRFFGNLFIGGRQEAIHRLEHCYLRTQARPDAA